jgi:aminoglycoside 6'-N-acetyltransferase I
MSVEIRALHAGDERVLDNVDDDVFDHQLRADSTLEFLSDPRHHIVVAIDDGVVVGMASGIHYVHPDKPAEFWINEVGVASSHRRAGVARALIEKLLSLAKDAGCREAWVLTDRDNVAAMRLYAATGGEEAPTDQVMFTYRL